MSKTADVDEAIARVARMIDAIQTRPQRTAFKFGKGTKASFEHVTVKGFDTVIDAGEGSEMSLTRFLAIAPEGSELWEATLAKLRELEGILQNLRIGEGDRGRVKTISDWLNSNAPQIASILLVVLSKVGGF